jgi:hypothetical protein
MHQLLGDNANLDAHSKYIPEAWTCCLIVIVRKSTSTTITTICSSKKSQKQEPGFL